MAIDRAAAVEAGQKEEYDRAMRFAWAVVVLGWSVVSCGRTSQKGAPPAERAVAKVGEGGVVTVQQLEQQMNTSWRAGTASGAADEHKRKVLEDLIRTEAAVEEARRRGYDRDPQLVRAMKQQLVARLMREEIDGKLTAQSVPDAEVEKYYRKHADEFQRADALRASAIFLPDEPTAKKVAALARAARDPRDPVKDQRAFRELVARHSQDEPSKARGGDLAYFDRQNAVHPPELVAAAFALAEVGDVAGPVKTQKGYAIVKVTHKRPGYQRQLSDAAPMIRQRLLHDLRNQRTVALMEELRKKAPVQIDEKALASASLPTTPARPAAPAKGPRPGPESPTARAE
jgi:peptidyl-prolyl cis-trans isomerase C